MTQGANAGATTRYGGSAPRAGDPDDDQVAALLARVRGQTTRVRQQGQRPPQYNAPDIWYTHPVTGEIVKLQGDPSSQAYYRSKGFHILTPGEVQQWETVVRPIVVAEQRKRAALITVMRQIEREIPGVKLAGDMNATPTDRLEAMLEELRVKTQGAGTVVTGVFPEEEPPAWSEDAGDDLAGEVQVSGGDDLEARIARQNAATRSRNGLGRHGIPQVQAMSGVNPIRRPEYEPEYAGATVAYEPPEPESAAPASPYQTGRPRYPVGHPKAGQFMPYSEREGA